MSRATEITTSRRGDVTNARDKQTVLCPLLISNYWSGDCCDCECAWFYCLLRSDKSTLQLYGLSEHVHVVFITNQKWVWLLSDCWLIFAYLIHSIELLFFNTESWVSNIVTSYNIINSLVILPHTILYVKMKTVQSPHKINCAIL